MSEEITVVASESGNNKQNLPINVNINEFTELVDDLRKIVLNKQIDSKAIIQITFEALKLTKKLKHLTPSQEEDLIYYAINQIVEESDLSESDKDLVMIIVKEGVYVVVANARDFVKYVKKKSFFKKYFKCCI